MYMHMHMHIHIQTCCIQLLLSKLSSRMTNLYEAKALKHNNPYLQLLTRTILVDLGPQNRKKQHNRKY